MHILVVDDDPKVRKLLRNVFEPEGFKVSEAADGEQVRSCMAAQSPDLITLDLGLPGEDGLSIARDIRSKSDIPIIMLTGKGDTIDRVVGLELGADDYIAKPFHVREVLARVRTVLRRSASDRTRAEPSEHASDTDTYSFSGWSLDLAKRELRAEDGRICPLTTGEFDLLALFVQHPKRVLSRDRLMDLLKGHDWSPLDRSIDNQVARLRKKIASPSAEVGLIKTVRGVGYSFGADVTKC